jgi:hypothetical protein
LRRQQQQRKGKRERQRNEQTNKIKHQSIYGRLHWAPGMGIDPAGGWKGDRMIGWVSG